MRFAIDSRLAKTGGREVEQSLRGVGRETDVTDRNTRAFQARLDRYQVVGRRAKAAISGVFAVTGAALGAREGLRSLVDFEGGLISVGKTANIQGQPLRNFGGEVIALRRELGGFRTNRLLELGEAAGQLGVTGTSNILAFQRSLAQLELSSDVVGSEGAKDLARILKITTDGIEQVGRFSSQLVSLGNQSAASESEILQRATRITQAISAFRPAGGDVLAVSAALAELGVEGELAGTSIGAFFVRTTQQLRRGGREVKVLADTTGVSIGEFARLFREEPVEAFERFITGLAGVREAAGPDGVIGVLEALGITGRRDIPVFQSLATRADALREKFAITRAEARLFELGLDDQGAATREASRALESLGKGGVDLLESILDLTRGQSQFSAGLRELTVDFADAFKIIGGASRETETFSDRSRTLATSISLAADAGKIFIGVRIAEYLRRGALGAFAFSTQLLVAAKAGRQTYQEARGAAAAIDAVAAATTSQAAAQAAFAARFRGIGAQTFDLAELRAVEARFAAIGVTGVRSFDRLAVSATGARAAVSAPELARFERSLLAIGRTGPASFTRVRTAARGAAAAIDTREVARFERNLAGIGARGPVAFTRVRSSVLGARAAVDTAELVRFERALLSIGRTGPLSFARVGRAGAAAGASIRAPELARFERALLSIGTAGTRGMGRLASAGRGVAAVFKSIPAGPLTLAIEAAAIAALVFGKDILDALIPGRAAMRDLRLEFRGFNRDIFDFRNAIVPTVDDLRSFDQSLRDIQKDVLFAGKDLETLNLEKIGVPDSVREDFEKDVAASILKAAPSVEQAVKDLSARGFRFDFDTNRVTNDLVDATQKAFDALESGNVADYTKIFNLSTAKSAELAQFIQGQIDDVQERIRQGVVVGPLQIPSLFEDEGDADQVDELRKRFGELGETLNDQKETLFGFVAGLDKEAAAVLRSAEATQVLEARSKALTLAKKEGIRSTRQLAGAQDLAEQSVRRAFTNEARVGIIEFVEGLESAARATELESRGLEGEAEVLRVRSSLMQQFHDDQRVAAILTDDLADRIRKASTEQTQDVGFTPRDARNELREEASLLQLTNREREIESRLLQTIARLEEGENVRVGATRRSFLRDLIDQNVKLGEQRDLLNDINGASERIESTRKTLRDLLSKGLITPEQFDFRSLQTKLDELRSKIGEEDLLTLKLDVQLEQARKGTGPLDGVAEGLIEIQKLTRDTSGLIGDTLQDAYSGAEDAFVGFVQTGKLDFSSLVDSIQADLARLAFRTGFNLLFGSGGEEGGGLLGGIIGSIIPSAKGNVFGPRGVLRSDRGNVFTRSGAQSVTAVFRHRAGGAPGLPGLEGVPDYGSQEQYFRTPDGALGSLREGGKKEGIFALEHPGRPDGVLAVGTNQVLPVARDASGRLGVVLPPEGAQRFEFGGIPGGVGVALPRTAASASSIPSSETGFGRVGSTVDDIHALGAAVRSLASQINSARSAGSQEARLTERQKQDPKRSNLARSLVR